MTTNFENGPPSATSTAGAIAQKPSAPTIVLLTPKEAAKLLKVSLSWLAKARMRGDGPPLCVPKTLSALFIWENRLTSAHNVGAALPRFHFDLAIQVEKPT